MLAVVMDQGVWPRDLIFLADDATATKDRGRAVDSKKGLTYACIGNPVAEGSQVTANHASPEMREDGQRVSQEFVKRVVGESRYGSGDGTMVAGGGAIGVIDTDEDRRTGLTKTILLSLAAHVTSRTSEQAGDGGAPPHLQCIR